MVVNYIDYLITALEYIPTYKDYREQQELDELKLRIKEIADNMEGVPEEFEKTFRKKFKDILA